MRNNFRFYISPYFLIRYYLERDIKYFVKKYKFAGKVLDIGCGQKPYEHLFTKSEYVGIDFPSHSENNDVPAKKPDHYFDEIYSRDLVLPFADESFGHAVSFQVLEHHQDPEKLIFEIARITRKEGLIMLSFPFIYALHEEPTDFQRLTEYKIKALFESNGCEIAEIKKQGSLFSTVSTLLSEHISYFAAKSRTYYFLAAVFYFPFLLFAYSCLFLDKIVKSDKIFINYVILARKG